VLTDAQRSVVSSQRELLHDLRGHLTTLEAQPDDVKIVSDSLSQLDEMFMVCVVGEFNAGKSSLINALIGERCLKEGVTPTTSQVCILSFNDDGDSSAAMEASNAERAARAAAAARKAAAAAAAAQASAAVSDGDGGAEGAEEGAPRESGAVEGIEKPVAEGGDPTADIVATRRLPVPWLSDAVIVDTPGTNAIVEGHTQLTEDIIPRCDMVLFVTSADRPFSESEHGFLERIWQWRKKVVVVLNKVDLFETAADREEVESFVLSNATKLLGEKPPLFGVSTRRAFRSKEHSSAQLLAGAPARSAEEEGDAATALAEAGDRFEALERYLVETLSTNERVELKLRNPLGVALRVVGKCVAAHRPVSTVAHATRFVHRGPRAPCSCSRCRAHRLPPPSRAFSLSHSFPNPTASRYEAVAETRGGVLREDVETLQIIDDQLSMYADDMRREVVLQRHAIENVLTRMVERCDDFLDAKLQLRNIPSLAWSPKGLQVRRARARRSQAPFLLHSLRPRSLYRRHPSCCTP
jgi:GTP-binding protein EngB required for normal cell division